MRVGNGLSYVNVVTIGYKRWCILYWYLVICACDLRYLIDLQVQKITRAPHYDIWTQIQIFYNTEGHEIVEK